MTKLERKVEGFTLIEVLIVMTILILLIALSMASFSGLRNTILLNENVKSLQQSIQYAQKASLLLRRETNERWLYGIGMDFTRVSATGEYRIFKWCSPFSEYGDVRTSSSFPNFDPVAGTLATSGSAGVNGAMATAYYENADPYNPSNKPCIGDISGSGSTIGFLSSLEPKSTGATSEQIPYPSSNAIQTPLLIGFRDGELNDIPYYILFEAVSGRVLFYDYTGRLINYTSSGEYVSTPTNLQIALATPNMRSTVLLSVSYLSGKVSISNMNADEVEKFNFVRVGEGTVITNEDGSGTDTGGNGSGTDVIIEPSSGGSDGSDGTKDSGGSDINEEK